MICWVITTSAAFTDNGMLSSLASSEETVSSMILKSQNPWIPSQSQCLPCCLHKLLEILQLVQRCQFVICPSETSCGLKVYPPFPSSSSINFPVLLATFDVPTTPHLVGGSSPEMMLLSCKPFIFFKLQLRISVFLGNTSLMKQGRSRLGVIQNWILIQCFVTS